MENLKRIYLFLTIFLFRIPLVLSLPLIDKVSLAKIKADVKFWGGKLYGTSSFIWNLNRLFAQNHEYRNLFLFRVRAINPVLSHFLSLLYRKMSTPVISGDIGSPLFIQHGNSTRVSVKKMGDNCWINQLVTVGYNVGRNGEPPENPIIGNNVRISAGACVLGGITVGDNVIIGANCVVVKNVPANCTVAGSPAYIIRENGERTYRKL